MKHFFIILLCISSLTIPLLAKESKKLKIGFGSCLHQEKESPILKTIQTEKLNYLIMLGDNIYADQLFANDKIPAYEKQFNRPEWKAIQKDTKLLFTWDDHDYGINDSGAEYSDKINSRNVFLKYVLPMMPKQISVGTENNEGIFYSYWIPFQGKKIHIIIPDTRYFRSPLEKSFYSYLTGKSQYSPSSDTTRTILGKEQWEWLLKELSKPSDLLIFVSSIQVLPTEQPFEKWNNFPHERDRLLLALQNANTKGLLLVSGDRHIAEIHEFKIPNKSSLIEITSSSLNLPLPFLPLEYDSELKIGSAYKNENYGTIQIFLKDGKLHWSTSIKDLNGNSVLELHSNLPTNQYEKK
ncbi:alkaline phosphatase D family protein [Leptospira limi]|uniref:Alkaline phosphatase family protein n=1 Tax=Leptospira limi TaxID=2950023 RepID=A0ABT3LWF7_9LEPT|nr:alkaline phosphatase D family protein [Leptospira limi]MCW7462045.1 alkaline phosphatase family protein [Leptospira limi]